MKANKILQKYFIIVLAMLGLFIFLGFTLMRLITKSLEVQPPESLPPIFIAKVIDHLSFENKIDAVKNFMTWQTDPFSPQLILFNQNNEILYSSVEYKKEWLPKNDILEKLKQPYDFQKFKSQISFRPENAIKPDFGLGKPDGPLSAPNEMNFNQNEPPLPPDHEFSADADHFPPPPSPEFGEQNSFSGKRMGMPPVGPMKGFTQDIVVKLNDNHNLYLLILNVPPEFNKNFQVKMDAQFKNKPSSFIHPKWMPYIGLFSLIMSLIIGVGCSIAFIYYSVRKKVVEADQVISQLQKGDLKARFKVDRQDEFGLAMLRFNYMADQIEKLVSGLKDAEIARTKLLQELAHDLRTPITALKTLNETLETRFDVLPLATQKELLHLSKKEIDYFSQLVEDLLLLSQVSEPKYHADQKHVNIVDICENEVEELELRLKNLNSNATATKSISFKTNVTEFNILGEPRLLQRMLRNVLENSISFCKSYVQLNIQKNEKNEIEILISDDGRGFDQFSLQNYGERKLSRQISQFDSANSRISVGLGSVIVKKICLMHDGELDVKNLMCEDGRVQGAQVKMKFRAS